jgi:glycosyltransferase involved in cell wall biosynthesis
LNTSEPCRVTVVICTHNRAQLLQAALESLVAQRDAPPFRVLVVDNASTDDTARVLAGFSGLDLTCVMEPRLGVSNARNRAIQMVETPLLVYFDDDCKADASWLRALVDSIDAGGPAAAAVGGAVRLEWPKPRPSWLGDSLLPALSAVDLGTERHRVDMVGELVVGGNIALSVAALRSAGGFNAGLGRKGNNLMGNEELDLLQRLIAAGGEVWYEPAAVVFHYVHEQRLRPYWFMRRSFFQGRSDILMREQGATLPGASDEGPPSGYGVQVRDWLLRLIQSRSRYELFNCILSVCYDCGRLVQKTRVILKR